METFSDSLREPLVVVDVPDDVENACNGKSDMMKIRIRDLRQIHHARGLEPPRATPGGVFGSEDICDVDVLALRRKVGMLFQLPALFEGTVADNVRYGPQLRGKKLSDNEVYKLLTLADLDSTFFNKPGGELSVGQAQRVALARTLANEPEVLLLDEPTSALDPISTQNIEDVLVKLKKNKGMTIVMVSHSIKQIQRIADVVALLVNGEVVEILKPDQLSEAKHPMAQRFLQLSS
ncbi:ABC transporter I family member 17 [Camellia lanceoleosa]|uniref:ABC transporter I family member 17 n=1 Tax=Camellia lanceoleosa TaxID=1840588 RepID=A0ACC0FBR3_9ERIC|nr:ABC transporter I family member 17 [Camellia lanceoleosa]